MTDKRTTLADEYEHVKILYNGDGGAGKTSHLSTLAKLGPIVHIDAESGLKPKALGRLGIPIENIEPFREITFEALESHFWDLKGRIEDGEIIGVNIDSLTEISRSFLEVIVKRGWEKGSKKADRMGEDYDRSLFDVYQEDYGILSEQMRNLVRKWRDLSCHVGFATLPRRDQDNDGAVTYGPGVTPAFQRDLVGYVDVLCWTYVDEPDEEGDDPTFMGQFSRMGTKIAKDRFKALPVKMAEPTFDRVIAYINEDLTEDTDPIQQEYLERVASRRARAAERRATRGPATPTDSTASGARAAGAQAPKRKAKAPAGA